MILTPVSGFDSLPLVGCVLRCAARFVLTFVSSMSPQQLIARVSIFEMDFPYSNIHVRYEDTNPENVS
jgi:hypothetical protein